MTTNRPVPSTRAHWDTLPHLTQPTRYNSTSSRTLLPKQTFQKLQLSLRMNLGISCVSLFFINLFEWGIGSLKNGNLFHSKSARNTIIFVLCFLLTFLQVKENHKKLQSFVESKHYLKSFCNSVVCLQKLFLSADAPLHLLIFFWTCCESI